MGVGCFILGFNYLKSTPIFSTDDTYYAVFDHSAGLQPGTPVTVNGVIVGTVVAVDIQQQTTKILVKFTCKRKFEFSKNSRSEIFSSLLGSAGLQIVPALDGAPLAQSGDTLKGSIQKGLMDLVGATFEPTSKNLNRTLISADTLLGNLNQTLDKTTQQNIKLALENLNTTLKSLAQVSAQAQKILQVNQENLQKSLQNTQTITANLARFTDTLNQAQLGKTLRNMEKVMGQAQGILAKLEKSDGTLGLLMNDKKLYENLRTTSSEMGLLLEDIRRNPKRYVHISIFGKKQKEYQTPTDVEISISEREQQLQNNQK